MRYLLILLLFIGCNSPTENQPVEKVFDPINIKHHVQTFSGDVRMRAYTNDSLIADTITSGRWDYETIVSVGDSLSTTVTFLEKAYGGTTILFTHNSDTVGSKCNFAAGFPSGYTIDCHFRLTENLYEHITEK